jgi:hypothetical protein
MIYLLMTEYFSVTRLSVKFKIDKSITLHGNILLTGSFNLVNEKAKNNQRKQTRSNSLDVSMSIHIAGPYGSIVR